jgi:hypothetical protein
VSDVPLDCVASLAMTVLRRLTRHALAGDHRSQATRQERPNDVSVLEHLIDCGNVNPAKVVALIGKIRRKWRRQGLYARFCYTPIWQRSRSDSPSLRKKS